MAKNLVIVESPTKAKTLTRFLGGDFTILSSYGHIRDLPKSDLGVDVDHGFTPKYEISPGSQKPVQAIKKAAKDAAIVYFATDEDREGEAISWHLQELLKLPAEKVRRITFHEITKEALQEALKNPRTIDENLVNAQQARRVLDRLVGYELSPLLWKKIAYGLSAGRVQSVAVRLVVERELERIAFVSATFWDLLATLAKDQQNFQASLQSIGDKRVATGKDFDAATGKLKNPDGVTVLSEKEAGILTERLKKEQWKVASIEEKPQTTYPAQPFTTSSLQMEANRKLGLSSRRTMGLAQRLYEEGLITYMRTDSPTLSQEAINGARSEVKNLYGDEFLSAAPRQFKAKSRVAQEAHEAIRPAGAAFRHPKDAGLTGKDLALYELIWKRTLASQMAEARKRMVSVRINAGDATFSATGSTIEFPGFLRVYVEGSDDPEAALGDKEVILPKLQQGDVLSLEKLEPQTHATKPPARFTDATLVKALEQDGVGRPSTYASIIGTILDRGYVRRVGPMLVPTFTAFAVIELLKKHFAHLVDVGFTSKMEEELDEIASGTLAWQPYLEKFYQGDNGFHAEIVNQEVKIDPKASRSIRFPHLPDHEVRIGKFGPYVVHTGEDADEENPGRASIPEDIAPADFVLAQAKELIQTQKDGPKSIGNHPDTGEPIYCLTGRFGPYVQLGEKTDEKPKPRRASLPRGLMPSQVTVELAVKLLSLPRVLGTHPESGKDVAANNGRFGPYVVHDGNFRSIPAGEDVYAITHERALELLAQEKQPRRGAAKSIRDLGPHPADQKPVGIYEGRYGQYVKHGATNATLPKGSDPQGFTLEEAVTLIEERKKSKRRGGKRFS